MWLDKRGSCGALSILLLLACCQHVSRSVFSLLNLLLQPSRVGEAEVGQVRHGITGDHSQFIDEATESIGGDQIEAFAALQFATSLYLNRPDQRDTLPGAVTRAVHLFLDEPQHAVMSPSMPWLTYKHLPLCLERQQDCPRGFRPTY